MKVELKKINQTDVESTATATKMKLSEDSAAMVFQLFTKNVYSNPIGTVVREITSNCFDSHIEAGVDTPVIIKKHADDDDENRNYISFIDFGVGMSPDRVYNIYGTYFESTKRVDNTQIGGFGIGGKTPLAYKRYTGTGEEEYDNSFYVLTNYNGMRYIYCIHEGEESPLITELHSEKTTERNGTEVRIPILEKDIRKFTDEIQRQLYYFENIIFEGFENYSHTVTNDYQIATGKNFWYRGSQYSNNMHVCLGRVTYPIDWNAVGESSYDFNIPIALKFEVGELNVTVSRESLDYSEKTIKILKKRLVEAKEELIEMLAKQYTDVVSLEDYFKLKDNFGILHLTNESSINISDIVERKNINLPNFRYKKLKTMPTNSSLFSLFFTSKQYGKVVKAGRYYNNRRIFDASYESLSDFDSLYHFTGEEFKRKVIKQSFLQDKHNTYYIIGQKDLTSEYYDERSLKNIFNVKFDKVEEPKKYAAFIKVVLRMQKEYFKIVQGESADYDKVEVTEEFLEERRLRRQILSENEKKTKISARFHYRGYDNRSKVKIGDLLEYKMKIFYGTQAEFDQLERASSVFNVLFPDVNQVSGGGPYNSASIQNKKISTIVFIQLAKNNLKYMKFCKNAFHIGDFKTKMLYRKENLIREYFQNHNFYLKYERLESLYKSVKYLSQIDTAWGETTKILKEYINLLPVEYTNNDIADISYKLNHYFTGLDNSPLTKEQEKVSKHLEDIEFLQESNAEIMRYIDSPYGLYDEREEYPVLIDMLKKVMVL